MWDETSKKAIVSRDVIFDEECILKLSWLHVNAVKDKVDENRNIVLVELDVRNASTKLPVERRKRRMKEIFTSHIRK